LTHDRPAAAAANNPRIPGDDAMSESPSSGVSEAFASLSHYGGLDWGKAGKVVLELAFDHTAQGWAGVREKIAAFPRLGVAIETSGGPAVERLLDLGLTVFPVNPKAAQRYRDRKRPSGGKSDALDGWSLADALRTDGRDWRPLHPQDPLTAELRMLCRDEVHLIEQRTALVNALQAALHEYYPAALQAFDDWTLPATWEFILAFPTPHRLGVAGKRKWEKVLHVHKLYRPQTAPQRLECFAQAQAFLNPNPAVTNAKSLLAVSLAKQLKTLETQLEEYRKRIEELFAQHPDHDTFDSLPGAGPKIAPRLLGAIGAQRQRFADPNALQCYAGAAPVSEQSGHSRRVHIRWACADDLRCTVHLWANSSRQSCAWAQAYYQQKKQQGMAHAAALRCLGQRWLKILWRMWQDGLPYDEALHLRNQVAHGSWVIALVPPAACDSTPRQR
jgi:transposase